MAGFLPQYFLGNFIDRDKVGIHTNPKKSNHGLIVMSRKQH